MTRLPILLCCLTAVVVTGEGARSNGRCERVAATYAELNAKARSCTSEAPIAVELASCRATTAGCNLSDQVAIDQFLGCVAQLPGCEAGGLSSWRAQYEACAAGIQLSASCSL